ncbi:unnamed protein product [Rotaria sp. Silwood2]|nr:unnamed protein product [Rotaria sp. Silwood2]CAF2664981.1 unnamed protein product [Rotaria sp. Silwood2]CAF2750109.1 unnamed protein product [Rotaria sp. Silwood2]CAF3257360.1 unnamed protein product [Rotaria sp. Silwood2]CAF4101702.1 unnamed protein product [Rotaria sp. Silwood2]
MDGEKSTTTAASSSSSSSTTNKLRKSLSSPTTTAATVKNESVVAATTTNSSVALPRGIHRVLQNFLLIWLDANADKSKDSFKKAIERLRHIIVSITTFTDAQKCIDFLSEIKNEKVFMIVSGSLGRHLIPQIHALPQLDSIYVFCGNQSVHEKWAQTISKIKGVYTKIKPICKALKVDCERCERAMISISFHGIDALFIYMPLFIEVLLETDDDETKSIKELADYCRLQSDIPEDEIEKIEREYRLHKPIWWYTAPYFIYSMLNRGLRLLDVDIILKMGFFIRQLHQDIKELHREYKSTTTINTTHFQVFRGQGLSMQNFEKMKQTEKGLMSFNSFLSTSRNRNISLQNFARPAALDPNSVGILFVMNIDPKLCAASSTFFVEVKNVGYYESQKEEILFSTPTIFRIDKIERIHDDHTDRLYEVNLTLTGNDENDLNTLVARIREESGCAVGWFRLGQILMKLGEFAKAEQLYQLLLEKASFDKDRADCNDILGQISDKKPSL